MKERSECCRTENWLYSCWNNSQYPWKLFILEKYLCSYDSLVFDIEYKVQLGEIVLGKLSSISPSQDLKEAWEFGGLFHLGWKQYTSDRSTFNLISFVKLRAWKAEVGVQTGFLLWLTTHCEGGEAMALWFECSHQNSCWNVIHLSDDWV
jgi:hypothetical protein